MKDDRERLRKKRISINWVPNFICTHTFGAERCVCVCVCACEPTHIMSL